MKINIIIVVITLVALSSVCNGFVTAAEVVIHPTPTINPSRITFERDDGIEFQNITPRLDYWNARLQWGLSQEQIRQYSDDAGETLLKDLTKSDGKWYHIKNLTKFDEELGRYIGLNNNQISQFILENEKQFEIDRMNSLGNYGQTSNVLANSSLSDPSLVLTPVSPSSQSVSGFTFTIAAFALVIISLIAFSRKERM
jgi:hypothetical protein